MRKDKVNSENDMLNPDTSSDFLPREYSEYSE